MKNNRAPILKGLIAIVAVIVIFSCISRLLFNGSDTLADYAKENPSLAYQESLNEPDDAYNIEAGTGSEPSATPLPQASPEPTMEPTPSPAPTEDPQLMIQKQFYYAALTEEQKQYITGCSYPSPDIVAEPAVSYEDLAYVHILHYDFDGNLTDGELICNKAIAEDLLEIFYELFLNEYQLEKVTLIENYDGDDELSMADNNSSCFNYRVVAGSKKLSQHAYGLAVDINPFYNPYVTYPDGGVNIAPAGSEAYADRTADFPYKIDENDLCYKLFKEHGFTWGGDWNSSKDYQHFQKALP